MRGTASGANEDVQVQRVRGEHDERRPEVTLVTLDRLKQSRVLLEMGKLCRLATRPLPFLDPLQSFLLITFSTLLLNYSSSFKGGGRDVKWIGSGRREVNPLVSYPGKLHPYS